MKCIWIKTRLEVDINNPLGKIYSRLYQQNLNRGALRIGKSFYLSLLYFKEIKLYYFLSEQKQKNNKNYKPI